VLKRIILGVVAFLLLWLAWEWLTFPDVEKLVTEPPKTTAFMELRREQLRDEGKSDVLEYRWVPYSRISPSLRRAVLVAEDNGFYEHEGVDVKGIREAFERDWKKRKLTHGGSTITQQLAKNLYLSPSRNPIRKLREYFIARSLEEHLSKKRILEIYLNVVEFGERTYGAEAAARRFFKTSAASLSAPQAALLAGCLPNPRVMTPANPNKRLRARQRMILSRMKRWGYLLEREVLTPRKAEPPTPPPETAPGTTTETVDPDLAPDTDSAAPDEVSPATTTEPSTAEPPAESTSPAVDAAPPATTTTSQP
jgi:monofunctional biosynthetic peptidoglycan transglycosylase